MSEIHVRLNGTNTVHIAHTNINKDGEIMVTGRKCNHWPGGGWSNLRAQVTTDAVTCKSCLRIHPAV